MKAVMLHVKLPGALGTKATSIARLSGKTIREVALEALKAQWMPEPAAEEPYVSGDIYPTYGSIPAPAERKNA